MSLPAPLAEKYGKHLTIVGIGPLSPLSEALKVDERGSLKSIGALYLQGIVRVEGDGDGARLHPVMEKSYNFREHAEAAVHVFEEMQDDVPFVTLGSCAASSICACGHAQPVEK